MSPLLEAGQGNNSHSNDQTDLGKSTNLQESVKDLFLPQAWEILEKTAAINPFTIKDEENLTALEDVRAAIYCAAVDMFLNHPDANKSPVIDRNVVTAWYSEERPDPSDSAMRYTSPIKRLHELRFNYIDPQTTRDVLAYEGLPKLMTTSFSIKENEDLIKSGIPREIVYHQGVSHGGKPQYIIIGLEESLRFKFIRTIPADANIPIEYTAGEYDLIMEPTKVNHRYRWFEGLAHKPPLSNGEPQKDSLWKYVRSGSESSGYYEPIEPQSLASGYELLVLGMKEVARAVYNQSRLVNGEATLPFPDTNQLFYSRKDQI